MAIYSNRSKAKNPFHSTRVCSFCLPPLADRQNFWHRIFDGRFELCLIKLIVGYHYLQSKMLSGICKYTVYLGLVPPLVWDFCHYRNWNEMKIAKRGKRQRDTNRLRQSRANEKRQKNTISGWLDLIQISFSPPFRSILGLENPLKAFLVRFHLFACFHHSH